MKIIETGLPTSLGEIINIKWHLDIIKNQYDQIKLSFDKTLFNMCLHTEADDWPTKKILWDKYLDDIGRLFFSEPPYVLTNIPYRLRNFDNMIRDYSLQPIKVNMGHILCSGKSLDIGEEYIVITTKARDLFKKIFLPLSTQLWSVLSKLSKKYKIVILGERHVEMRKEYGSDTVFGIYEQIIANLPNERILDLTVPALGETVADLKDIRQDCLIMKEAKFVVTVGIGGNFCLSTSVANMAIGYRHDNLAVANKVFGQEYSNAIITKDWNYFIKVLERYL